MWDKQQRRLDDDGKDICPLDSTDAAPHRPRPRRRLYQVIICGRSGSFGRSPYSQVRHATAEVPSEAARSASAPRPSGPAAYRRPARAGGVGRSRRQILLRVSREIGLGEIGSGVARSGWLTNPAPDAAGRAAFKPTDRRTDSGG